MQVDSLTLAVTANGTAADQVFDTAKGIGGSPTSTVLPGKSITYTVAFGLPTTGEPTFRLRCAPAWDRLPAGNLHWTSLTQRTVARSPGRVGQALAYLTTP